jgi:tetratricopeptide (TPR) repeat protein
VSSENLKRAASSSLNQDEVNVLEILAFLYINLGYLDKAEKTVNAILVVEPSNIWAVFAFAVISFKKGDYNTTVVLIDKLLKKKSIKFNVIELKKLKARALFRLHKKDEATEIMRNILDEVSSQKKDNQ